jgi:hypothetical protein
VRHPAPRLLPLLAGQVEPEPELAPPPDPQALRRVRRRR